MVQLVSVGHHGKDAHHELSSQVRAFAHVLVAGAVRVVLSEGLGVLDVDADIASRRAGGHKRALERVRLFGRGLDFDLRYNPFDGSTLEDMMAQTFVVSRAPAFLTAAPEGYGADGLGSVNVAAFSPKCGSMTPIAELQWRKRQHRQARAAALESAHNVSRQPLGRAGYAQVDVIPNPASARLSKSSSTSTSGQMPSKPLATEPTRPSRR